MTSYQISQDVFNMLYAKLCTYLNPLDTKLHNFVSLLVKSMELVHQWAQSLEKTMVVHGLEKKEIVISLMTQLAEKFDEKKDDLLRIEHSVMDKLIDIFVAAEKGQFVFKEIQEEVTKCCSKKTISAAKTQRKRKDVAAPTDATPLDISAVVDAAVNQVYDNIKSMIVNKQFNASSFVTIVTMVMQLLTQFPQLTGPQKKNVAIQVITRLVQEIPIPGIDQPTAALLINTTLSTMIDAVIAAANGQFNFTQIVEEVKGCFPCLKKQN